MGMFKDLKKLKEQGKEVAEQSGRPTSMMGMLKQMPQDLHNATEMVDEAMAQQAQQQQLMATGTPGRATIKGVQDTGSALNDAPVALLDLEVQVEGKDPYAAQVKTAVPQLYLARLQIGGQIGVRVDATNPSAIAVDWAAP
jgi:hypothetical protein